MAALLHRAAIIISEDGTIFARALLCITRLLWILCITAMLLLFITVRKFYFARGSGGEVL